MMFAEGEYVLYLGAAAQVLHAGRKQVIISYGPQIGGWWSDSDSVPTKSITALSDEQWFTLKAVSSFGTRGALLSKLGNRAACVPELVAARLLVQEGETVWVGSHGLAALRWKGQQGE